ncbi:MAG: hypothetical protein LC130_07600 [Bryobacterales bacterium]|nr:hypothetical protein [Bryobacterales bacterium]
MSHRKPVILALFLLGAVSMMAQPVRVYSEFQRINPFGQVVEIDKAARPREVLSPAVIRNGNSGFHLAITARPGTTFSLHLGQNPENAAGVTVYREIFVQSGKDWIPDGLEKISLPFDGQIGSDGIPGQTTAVFWLDVRLADDAPVRRIKVEPQVWMAEHWVPYPMEVRVVKARVPKAAHASGPLPRLEERADAPVLAPLRSYVCGTEPHTFPGKGSLNVRGLVRRGVEQDLMLARALENKAGRDAVIKTLLRHAGAATEAEFCGTAAPGRDAEWYLRFRDYLLRESD